MRLGLLGPSEGSLDWFSRGASFLLDEARVDRAIYLAADESFDRAVEIWGRTLVRGDPTFHGLITRATEAAKERSPAELQAWVQREQARQKLLKLECLPGSDVRAVEILCDRITVLLYDKARLDEDDIFSATFLVYGRSEKPLIRSIGPRWFLSPGRLSEEGGIMVCEERSGALEVERYDAMGNIRESTTLDARGQARVRVQGGGAA